MTRGKRNLASIVKTVMQCRFYHTCLVYQFKALNDINKNAIDLINDFTKSCFLSWSISGVLNIYKN